MRRPQAPSPVGGAWHRRRAAAPRPNPAVGERLARRSGAGGDVAIRGIGIDVVQVERLVKALERFGERMERRLFTDAELAYCRSHKDPLPHLAARFAAKEAAFKAIGTGLSS